MNDLPNVEQSYGTEIVRKAIHLCSLSIPIVYFYVGKSTFLYILIPLTLAFAVTDLARFYIPRIGEWYYKYFGWLLRAHERNNHSKRLTGATYVLLSATLCVMIFPKVIVITAFAILIISDSVAALIGRRYGKRPFFQKSLEGTTAFFLSALLVVALAPKVEHLPVEYVVGIVSAFVGAVVEALPITIDDNLSIPLSIGAVMWLMYAWLLPTVNVFGLEAIR